MNQSLVKITYTECTFVAVRPWRNLPSVIVYISNHFITSFFFWTVMGKSMKWANRSSIVSQIRRWAVGYLRPQSCGQWIEAGFRPGSPFCLEFLPLDHTAPRVSAECSPVLHPQYDHSIVYSLLPHPHFLVPSIQSWLKSPDCLKCFMWLVRALYLAVVAVKCESF